MQDFYLVEWKCSESDNQWLCSTVAEANETIAQKLGEFIIDCVKNNNQEILEDFISKLHYDEIKEDGNVRICLYTPDDDIYITKLKLHDKRWN